MSYHPRKKHSRHRGGARSVLAPLVASLALAACGSSTPTPSAPAGSPELEPANSATSTPQVNDPQSATPQSATPKSATVNGYDIEIIELTEQPAIAMSGQASPTELQDELGVIIPKLLAYALANRLQVAGPPFVRYPQRSETSIEYEAGLPVLKPGDGTDAIRPISLPAGPAATTVHVGPYEQLLAAHAALASFSAGSQRPASGPGWEVFLTNPLQEPDPASWRTKVFLPLQPR